MGSGTVFSIYYGRKDEHGLKEGILASFTLLAAVTVLLHILTFCLLDWTIAALRTPDHLVGMTREYLAVIFVGMTGIFLYNFLLRCCVLWEIPWLRLCFWRFLPA